MVVNVDLYLASEGKDTSARKGGLGGGRFARWKGKLGTIEEGPQHHLIIVVVEKNKL